MYLDNLHSNKIMLTDIEYHYSSIGLLKEKKSFYFSLYFISNKLIDVF